MQSDPLWFLNKSEKKTAPDLLNYKFIYDEKQISSSIENYNALISSRVKESTTVFQLFKKLIEINHDCLLFSKKIKSSKKKVILVSSPLPFDGRIFDQTAVINIYNTRKYSKLDFQLLVAHELIHLFQMDALNTKVLDEIDESLFLEGLSVFGSMEVLNENSLERVLNWSEAKTDNSKEHICQVGINSTSDLKPNIDGLFNGSNKSLGRSRIGYYLGAKMLREISNNSRTKWCNLSVKSFLREKDKLVKHMLNLYCER